MCPLPCQVPGDVATPLRSSSHFQPAVDRSSPGIIDLCLHLPAAAAAATATQTLSLTVQFSRAFLTIKEYPPDSHRGFDVPSALLTYIDVQDGSSGTSSLESTGVPWSVADPGQGPGFVLEGPLIVQLGQAQEQQASWGGGRRL